MQTAKSWFSVVMALLPVLFFGGMFLYFTGVNNASFGLFDGALGPTRIGLGALTILFVLLFLWRLKRVATPPPAKVSLSSADSKFEETKSDFDADAAMERYLARRGTGGSAPVPAPTPTFVPPPVPTVDGVPIRPGGFGRKGTFQ